MNDTETRRTLLEASGYRIPPYRLARMSDLSNKIVKLILTDGVCAWSAAEAKLILHLAEDTIRTGEKEWS